MTDNIQIHIAINAAKALLTCPPKSNATGDKNITSSASFKTKNVNERFPRAINARLKYPGFFNLLPIIPKPVAYANPPAIPVKIWIPFIIPACKYSWIPYSPYKR